MSDKLRVLYDYQTFHIQRFGGISRYFYEIATRMPDVRPSLALRFSMNQYIRDRRMGRYCAVPRRPFKLLEGLFRYANRRASLQALERGSYEVFHPTYYDPYFLPTLEATRRADGREGSIPFVLTIHDMTHERYPQYFAAQDPTPQYKRLLASRASRIIAISECTKRDIMAYLQVPEEKIDVIYHGIAPAPLAEGRPADLPADYILYVGERRRYKNFERTMEAFAQVQRDYPTLHLVLTGRPLSKEEMATFTQYDLLDKVCVMQDISDTVLAQLYRHARLFLYPSLYEGFGIPILEAYAQDCPVVLSRASCFPEVAGEAAAYFDPLSVDDMVRAMHHVLDDEEYRRALIDRGRERLSLFTWERTAQLTEATYRRALT